MDEGGKIVSKCMVYHYLRLKGKAKRTYCQVNDLFQVCKVCFLNHFLVKSIDLESMAYFVIDYVK